MFVAWRGQQAGQWGSGGALGGNDYIFYPNESRGTSRDSRGAKYVISSLHRTFAKDATNVVPITFSSRLHHVCITFSITFSIAFLSPLVSTRLTS
jgi:hypothetical protein